MKRSGFKRPVYEAPPPAPLTPITRKVSYTLIDSEVSGTYAKVSAYRSEAWRRAVASLPCAECGAPPPSQAAHINHLGKGLGLKPPDVFTVPLCPTHHSAYDQGKDYTREQRHEVSTAWLHQTLHALALAGLIRPHDHR